MDDRKLERHQKKQPLTPDEKWSATIIDRLTKLCGVGDSDHLPPLYHDLAAFKKTNGGTVRQLLEDRVHEAATVLGINHRPVVTVQHARGVLAKRPQLLS